MRSSRLALTIAWAEQAGVHLHTLWYATFGFRTDASLVLADQSGGPRVERALILLAIAVAAGIALVIGLFLRHLREEWSADRVLTAATLAVVLVEVGALVAGGSYWRDYLHALVPGAALCVAQLARRHPAHRPTRLLVVGALASCAVSLVVWVVITAAGLVPYTEARTGEALAAWRSLADSLTVFGGRADIQYAAGLAVAVQAPVEPSHAHPRPGPERPTGPGRRRPIHRPGSWSGSTSRPGTRGRRPAAADVEERYVEHGLGCDDRPVYLLRGSTVLSSRPTATDLARNTADPSESF